ncbi:MAG: alkaline phosphatase family protein, partial [Gemmatimonadota bacterium]|nr:alkaline phosphatase family protein [Gemmatimonadota bacterium]
DGIDESIAGDELRARYAVRMIESRHPALMLAYFTALDHEQHGSGPFSRASLATLERIDAIIGLLAGAADRAYGGDAVIAIVSDHGFQRTSHAVNLSHALRSAGLVDYAPGADDKPTAWRAAIWPGGASAAIVLEDTSDARTRDRVIGLLRSLAADSTNGIDRVIDGAELRRRGGFPGAIALVNLREGYTLGDNSRGPLVVPVSAGGMHGYLPDATAMRASFIIAGPGIPAGRALGVIDQRAVAPTLAKVLGVRLPQAEVESVLP